MAVGRGGHGHRGALAFSRGVSPGEGRSLGPQAQREWESLVLRPRAGGPVPFHTTMEESGEEPQHQADHGGAALKGAVLLRAVTAPRGTIVLGARSGGAETRGTGNSPFPWRRQRHRAPPARGGPAAASLLPPLSSLCRWPGHSVPGFMRLFCPRYLAIAVVTAHQSWL